MAEVATLDCGLSKPQLLRVMQKYQKQALGMHVIAKSLSEADIEFAHETFAVFAEQLDDIAYSLQNAIDGNQEWFNEVVASPRHRK